MFKIFIIVLILSLRNLCASNADNYENEVFLDCTNDYNQKTFNLTIPTYCKTDKKYSWNNNTYTEISRIIVVSTDYVLIPESEKNKSILLLNYMNYDEDHPTCIPENYTVNSEDSTRGEENNQPPDV
uniref:CPXV174 protein n=1 Tax=Strongyloides venezuelensis TaxID=75913 RepID=A0A0K0FZ77_STRVS